MIVCVCLFVVDLAVKDWDVDALPETTLSYASVMGIQEDLHLVGDQYQWLGSMFYFGMYFSTSFP